MYIVNDFTMKLPTQEKKNAIEFSTPNMKKQFWIMVKQFLLYLFLDQGVALLLMIPMIVYAIVKKVPKEGMEEFLTTSPAALWTAIICYILIISVFLKKRYVKLRL